MLTQFLHIPYDEERLSAQEIDEIECFAESLFYQLEDKVKEMGLSMTDFTITKFTQQELDNMPVVYKGKDGKFYLKEQKYGKYGEEIY